MTPAIIVHYHEIALKGGNRDWFERKLIENIRWALRDVAGVEVRRMSGRVVVRWTDDARLPAVASAKEGMQPTDSARLPAEGSAKAGITDALQKVFGIANILVGHEVRQEYSGLEEDIVSAVRLRVAKQYDGRTSDLQHRDGEYAGCDEERNAVDLPVTFAVRVKRGNKKYPMNSMELERKLGAAINEATGWKVDLTNPDLTVNIEIVERTAFVFAVAAEDFTDVGSDVGAAPRGRPRECDGVPPVHPHPQTRKGVEPTRKANCFAFREVRRAERCRVRETAKPTPRPYADNGRGVGGKIAGPGGLPVGVSGRVMSLVSSGFDSPVASWMMMKRGCIVDFVHFHSYPYTSDASKRNVEEIVRVLQPFQQGRGHLYAVPLIEYQKQILTQAPHELRVLLYRRMMFRVADAIARAHGAEALVTGENLGQVASQTIPNMAAVETASSLPVFRPLLGFDKQEIINRAEAIGTAEISKRPYDDCCSLFTPQHPATHTTSDTLDAVERDLQAEEWAQKLLALVECGVVMNE